MCFHNSMSRKAAEVAARYRREYWRNVDFDELEKYHFNAFSNPKCTVVTTDNLQVMNWGLIPFWAKTEQSANEIRKLTYNARSETIFQKPAFKYAIQKRRCIIPSTGYFEYHHNEDKSKTPYYIYLKNIKIFSMAGIFDLWTNPVNGDVYQTFSLITTIANDLTSKIHNGGKNPKRMPLILKESDEEKWLFKNLSQLEIENFFKSFEAVEMDAYPIEKLT